MLRVIEFNILRSVTALLRWYMYVESATAGAKSQGSSMEASVERRFLDSNKKKLAYSLWVNKRSEKLST